MAQPSMAQRRRFQRLPPELANEIDRLSKILVEAARRALVTRLSLHRNTAAFAWALFRGELEDRYELVDDAFNIRYIISLRARNTANAVKFAAGGRFTAVNRKLNPCGRQRARLPVNASAGRRPHKCEFRRRAGHVPPWPFLRWDAVLAKCNSAAHALSSRSNARSIRAATGGRCLYRCGYRTHSAQNKCVPMPAPSTQKPPPNVQIVPSIAGNADLFGISNQFIGSAAGGAQCTPSDNDQKLIRLIE
uniref:Baseplate_J domain-containing protein n=1 Tax=Globodera pallida TaxID=36090 RepID=A0A183C4T8_GLOPA